MRSIAATPTDGLPFVYCDVQSKTSTHAPKPRNASMDPASTGAARTRGRTFFVLAVVRGTALVVGGAVTTVVGGRVEVVVGGITTVGTAPTASVAGEWFRPSRWPKATEADATLATTTSNATKRARPPHREFIFRR